MIRRDSFIQDPDVVRCGELPPKLMRRVADRGQGENLWRKLRRYGFALGLDSIKLVDRELQPEVVLSGVFKELDDTYQALVRSQRKKGHC